MHHTVRKAFQRQLSEYDFGGGRVLEVGVEPHQELLSSLPVFETAADVVLLDISFDDAEEYRSVQANVNELPFDRCTFECVVINAVFEHDPYFWKGLQEIERVTTRDGVVGIGVPGYSSAYRRPSWLERLGLRRIAIETNTEESPARETTKATSPSPWYQRVYDALPDRGRQGVRQLYQTIAAMDRDATTPVLGTHGEPSDFYRFSESAVRNVFFEHFTDIVVEEVLNPPRYVGTGRIQEQS